MGIDLLSYCTHGRITAPPHAEILTQGFSPSLSLHSHVSLMSFSDTMRSPGKEPHCKTRPHCCDLMGAGNPPQGAVIECRPAEQMCSDAPSSVHKASQPAAYYGCRISSHRKKHDLWLFLLMTSQWDHHSWPLRLTPFPLNSRDRCENNSLCNMLITILTNFLFNLYVKGFARGDEPTGNYYSALPFSFALWSFISF